MTHSTIVNMEHCSSDHEPTESSLQSAESISELSNPVGIGNVSNETASRAIQLSNRDRLLLRRQALRMKKRPVLAVGDFKTLLYLLFTPFAIFSATLIGSWFDYFLAINCNLGNLSFLLCLLLLLNREKQYCHRCCKSNKRSLSEASSCYSKR